jgi:hypothetical protein
MSNVIYDRAKPQEEQLLALLPTQYEGYKLTAVQREVVEFILKMMKSEDPKVRYTLRANPLEAYLYAYLWLKFPAVMAINNPRHVNPVLQELGEDSKECREIGEWADFIMSLYSRLGYRPGDTVEMVIDRHAPLQEMRREMKLTGYDLMIIWFEHMLANC